MTPNSVDDYRSLAKRRLPRMVFDYLDGGAESERGLHRNLEAFAATNFAPRRLVDVSRRSSSVSLFGRTLPTPFVVAPTGLNGALWPDGDVALARAARSAGIPFVLSTASNATIEDVAERAGGDLWFQLYVVQRDLAQQLVGRAKEAGYRVLVLTVDVAVNGKRERDLRNGFGIPFRQTPRSVLDAVTHPRWTLRQIRHGLPQLANFASPNATDVNAQAALMRRQMDASFCWEDLQALRDAWPGLLIVKGIMTSDRHKSMPGAWHRCRRSVQSWRKADRGRSGAHRFVGGNLESECDAAPRRWRHTPRRRCGKGVSARC